MFELSNVRVIKSVCKDGKKFHRKTKAFNIKVEMA